MNKMSMVHETLSNLRDRQIRVSNTAKEGLFTIGMSYYLFELLGDYRAKVTVTATLTKGIGVKIKVQADKKGTQLLRNINHKELGLRINSKQGNPVDFPFKSINLPVTVDEKNKSFEFSIPLSKMKVAKPRNTVRDDFYLFQEPKVQTWPTDADVDRAIKALEEARLGTRGAIPRQAMRKALLAGMPQDTRTEDEKDLDMERYSHT